MTDYISKKLSNRSLMEIVENCRKALIKGYLDDAEWEKEGILRVIRMRDFQQFKRERKEANERYDKFCEELEKVLPEIEKIVAPIDRLKHLYEFYKKALEYDGKRRWYDRGLNDQYGGQFQETILIYHTNLMKDLLKKIGREDLLFDIINGYEFDSFRVEMMKDYISFLFKLPDQIKKKVEISIEDIKSLESDLAKDMKKLAEKYTHSNLENVLQKLKLYQMVIGKEKEILEDLERKRKERVIKRKKAIEEIKGSLQKIGKLSYFEQLLQNIDELTYYNVYEDEYRHTQLKELADYFLREEVAKILFEMGAIPSPNPMDYPQRYLLKKIEEVLGLRKRK
ncbi:MAG: hypothetical protein QXS37_02445 [Candidatus Aenigmatarchaeota archaeon]